MSLAIQQKEMKRIKIDSLFLCNKKEVSECKSE